MEMEIEVYHLYGENLMDHVYREDFDPETQDRGFVVYDRVYFRKLSIIYLINNN